MKQIVFLILLISITHLMYCDGTPAEGVGTYAEPYLIETLDNLLWLSTNSSLWADQNFFEQTANIDASETQNWNDGAGFSPIGIDWEFHGIYNGAGHIIGSLYINRPEAHHVGLFGFTYEAEIKNLGLTNVNITGDSLVAGLVGKNDLSSVDNCFVTGDITGRMSPGGIAGWNLQSELNNCFADCNVTGEYGVGGLVGRNTYYSPISRSFSCGSVEGYHFVGGLTGVIYNSIIDNCFSTCDVTGEEWVGGFVGYNDTNADVSDCYSIGSVEGDTYVGGFAGYNMAADITSSVWNTETSGPSNAIGHYESGTITELIGKTTAEMQLISTYTDIGWDFIDEIVNGNEDIWKITDDLNSGYPYISDLEVHVNLNENTIDCIPPEISIYPNPFNPVTNILCEIYEPGIVQVDIYNTKGQKVRSLLNSFQSPGAITLQWDGCNDSGCNACSNIYFCRIRSDNYSSVKKILLLK